MNNLEINNKSTYIQAMTTVADYLGCSVDYIRTKGGKSDNDFRDEMITRIQALSDEKAESFLNYLESLDLDIKNER